MQQHPRAPHVYYEVLPGRAKRIVHCQCVVCRDHMHWPCRGSDQMLTWRIENYVNMHLHGAGPPVQFRMPRR
jgi:hypothetical protein